MRRPVEPLALHDPADGVREPAVIPVDDAVPVDPVAPSPVEHGAEPVASEPERERPGLVARLRARLAAAYAPVDLGRTWVWSVAIAIAAAGIAFARVEPGTRTELWAEDGRDFLRDAYASGGGAILDPFAGYAHLVPRLVAWAVSELVPLASIGLAMTIAASCIVGVVTGVAFHAARTRTGVLPAVLAALLLAFLPIGSMEVAGNVANSHWYLMAGAAWVLASRPTGRGWGAVGGIVLVVAAMSDPLTALLLPFALPRLLAGTWTPRIQVLALGAALAVQALVVLGTSRERSGESPELVSILVDYVVRVGLGSVVGGLPADGIAAAMGPSVVVATGAVVLAALLAGALAVARTTLLPLVALGTSVAFWVVVQWVVWPNGHLDDITRVSHAQRYSVNALALVAIAVVLLVDALLRRAGRTPRGIAAAAAAIVVAGATLWSSVPSFQSDEPRNPHFPLAVAVDVAVDTCTDDPDETILLPGDPWQFGLEIACDDVLEHAG